MHVGPQQVRANEVVDAWNSQYKGWEQQKKKGLLKYIQTARQLDGQTHIYTCTNDRQQKRTQFFQLLPSDKLVVIVDSRGLLVQFFRERVQVGTPSWCGPQQLCAMRKPEFPVFERNITAS